MFFIYIQVSLPFTICFPNILLITPPLPIYLYFLNILISPNILWIIFTTCLLLSSIFPQFSSIPCRFCLESDQFSFSVSFKCKLSFIDRLNMFCLSIAPFILHILLFCLLLPLRDLKHFFFSYIFLGKNDTRILNTVVLSSVPDFLIGPYCFCPPFLLFLSLCISSFYFSFLPIVLHNTCLIEIYFYLYLPFNFFFV